MSAAIGILSTKITNHSKLKLLSINASSTTYQITLAQPQIRRNSVDLLYYYMYIRTYGQRIMYIINIFLHNNNNNDNINNNNNSSSRLAISWYYY